MSGKFVRLATLPPNNVDCKFGCFTAQKMKFCIKDFFSKCDQIRSFRLDKTLSQAVWELLGTFKQLKYFFGTF